MKSWIFSLLFAIASAGRVPYLGGDLEQYVQESKRSTVGYDPRVNRPVTPQQKEQSEKFNTKFTEIAKAYAEGYKAAIKAVQARALIAQKRLYQNRVDARSKIPASPTDAERFTERSTVRSNVASFTAPVPNEITENGMEKSGIPRPDVQFSNLNVNDNKLEDIATLLPPASVNRQLGSVLSESKDKSTEKKRSLDYELNNVRKIKRNRKKRSLSKKHGNRHLKSIRRHRRSHMPYLGQNLDIIGVVRARPNWESGKKKTLMPNVPAPVMPKQAFNLIAPIRARIPAQMSPQVSSNVYARKYNNNYRAVVPKQVYNPFAQRLQAAQQTRQNIAYNPYYNAAQQYSNPYYNGFVPSPEYDDKNVVESPTKETLPGVDRKKKSASPEPDVAVLNYAARHRNVYLDGVSGDPYSGGSSVLSRQNVYYKKH